MVLISTPDHWSYPVRLIVRRKDAGQSRSSSGAVQMHRGEKEYQLPHIANAAASGWQICTLRQ
jgi:hypothetical protein